MAFWFVLCAAIASGLTIGLLVGGCVGLQHLYDEAVAVVIFFSLSVSLFFFFPQSIDTLELEIKQRVGTEDERWQAERILPLLHRRHLLLVTLLLFNSLAAEALPLALGELVPGYAAVIISVTMVLIFGR